MSKRRKRLKHGTRVLAQPRAEVTLARPTWDQGATGPANRIGLVTEERGDYDTATGKRINPNGVKGVRRVDMLEVYKDKGYISKRGYTAAEALRAAWEATFQGKGADLTDVRVDRTPKPDAAIDIRIDRVSALVMITRKVPPEDQDIVVAVVCEGHSIGRLAKYRGRNFAAGKAHLFEALERLAERMGG